MYINVPLADYAQLNSNLKEALKTIDKLEILLNSKQVTQIPQPLNDNKVVYKMEGISSLEPEIKRIREEVHNAAFTIYFDGENWHLTVVKSATKFIGGLREVLLLYIEEIHSYKEVPTPKKGVKFKKPWTYTR